MRMRIGSQVVVARLQKSVAVGVEGSSAIALVGSERTKKAAVDLRRMRRMRMQKQRMMRTTMRRGRKKRALVASGVDVVVEQGPVDQARMPFWLACGPWLHVSIHVQAVHLSQKPS
jgi:hypothetical protein